MWCFPTSILRVWSDFLEPEFKCCLKCLPSVHLCAQIFYLCCITIWLGSKKITQILNLKYMTYTFLVNFALTIVLIWEHFIIKTYPRRLRRRDRWLLLYKTEADNRFDTKKTTFMKNILHLLTWSQSC